MRDLIQEYITDPESVLNIHRRKWRQRLNSHRQLVEMYRDIHMQDLYYEADDSITDLPFAEAMAVLEEQQPPYWWDFIGTFFEARWGEQWAEFSYRAREWYCRKFFKYHSWTDEGCGEDTIRCKRCGIWQDLPKIHI